MNWKENVNLGKSIVNSLIESIFGTKYLSVRWLKSHSRKASFTHSIRLTVPNRATGNKVFCDNYGFKSTAGQSWNEICRIALKLRLKQKSVTSFRIIVLLRAEPKIQNCVILDFLVDAFNSNPSNCTADQQYTEIEIYPQLISV